MAANFSGKDLIVMFNTVVISGSGRVVTLTEAEDPPTDVDVTHKGDASKVVVAGLPGAPKTTVKLDLLDETGGVGGAVMFALNTKDTLTIYPEGSTGGHQKITVNNARFYSREQSIPYDGAVAWSMTWEAKNTTTYGSV